ncbi:hypothetical protein BDB01DRAFT_781030 [Pilobolus umbonatus]|nr:hypothetical protein BDB01DRAFT_781030 [Pilobolus umbonatus]
MNGKVNNSQGFIVSNQSNVTAKYVAIILFLCSFPPLYTQYCSMEVVINIAEKSSEQFVQFFYSNYDKQRQNLGNLYSNESAILWNGTAFAGGLQYSEFLARLPLSQHEVDVYDCHPIPASMNAQGVCGILITVTGTVKYSNNPVKRTFAQTFILMPDEKQAGNYYVQSDNFRFV